MANIDKYMHLNIYNLEVKLKMFRRSAVILFTLCIILISAGCSMSDNNKDVIIFDDSNVIHANYMGIGVEFDVYEHPEIIREEQEQLIFERLDKLKPSMVRMMMNYTWIVKNLDTKGTLDVLDDTWEYNFSSTQAKNMFQLLDYLEEKGISVALGPWRAIDGWTTETSDPRWAKITGRLFEEIIDRGYTVVKWFVPSNEPNYIQDNTYEIWSTGVKNVYNEFKSLGLDTKVGIIGTDVSSYDAALSWADYLESSTTRALSNYSVHLYVSDRTIDTGKLAEQVSDIVNAHKKKDSKLDEKGFIVWEAGLIDGRHEFIDTNELIDTFNYGLRMVDYTIQTMLGRANGIVYWELDDGAHFLPTGGNGTWGMFSSLGNPWQQEVRPWFHSSQLLSNLYAKGTTIYSGTTEIESGFRMIGGISEDGTTGSMVAVNRTKESITKKFVFDKAIEDDTLYIYIFNEKDLKLGNDGYIIPNYTMDGSLNQITTFEIPANTALIITNKKI